MGNGNSEDLKVLDAAYAAWSAWGDFRSRRARSKDFTYGRQWNDLVKNDDGKLVTEYEHVSGCGKEPLTNNLLRQLIKCVVGRFRKSIADEDGHDADAYVRNCIDELDSRALEEFLISGCCVQRVEWGNDADGNGARVDNVNVNRFFANVIEDVRGDDCEIVGCLHDLRVGEIIMRLADGDLATAQRIREVYSGLRSVYNSSIVGQDTKAGRSFWQAQNGKCRAIEVWTLELVEVLKCHDCESSQCWVEPIGEQSRLDAENRLRRAENRAEIIVSWGVEKEWHCRWFAPNGVLLRHFVSPYKHGGHPFVMKLYPLTDGEIHSFIEDILDQQKYVNRLITVIDHIMNASAKGVLLFPENGLPDGFTWADIRRMWSNSNSIIPFSAESGGVLPQQIVSKGTDVGAYELLTMQMKLMNEISGVSGVLRGEGISGNQGVKLYESQLENSDTSLADIYGAFATFRKQRNAKMALL